MISRKLFYDTMNYPGSSYPSKQLSYSGLWSVGRKKLFIWFCAFLMIIALLELGQDYLSATLNGNSFLIGESLSYKLFWLLFIPLTMALYYALREAKKLDSKPLFYAADLLLVTTATIIHLTVFSVILFGISNLMYEEPVTLLFLLYEKLSTRLYLALSIYFFLSVLYLLYRNRPSQQDLKIGRQKYPSTLTVKNGRRTVLVEVAEILWIGSDGAYLEIHTKTKKHVVLNTLKHIIKELPSNFKRIHKSTIVNIDCISELKSRGNGDYDVIMDDGSVLRLSRNYTKQLKGILL